MALALARLSFHIASASFSSGGEPLPRYNMIHLCDPLTSLSLMWDYLFDRMTDIMKDSAENVVG